MDQFFEYHVDKKEMDYAVLERSLKVYINNFDSSRSYLLLAEVEPYLKPSEQFLRKILADYRQDRFSAYFAINEAIQKSIIRARSWRESWERDPKGLIEKAKQVSLKENVKEKNHPVTQNDLSKRHHDRLVQFIAFQMKELGPCAYEGKEAKLVALCEKQLRLVENAYLGLDDQERPLSQEKLEHKMVLRTLKAMSQSLDAHTTYYSPEEALALKVQLEKGMCGIGVVLREGIEGITIQEMIKGGPAEKCGKLKVGDTIVEVDGIPVQEYSFHHVLEIMRGNEGSKTVLKIVRQQQNRPEYLKVELTRSKIVLDDKRVDVESEPFGDGIIGKITLYSFYEGDNGLSSEKDLKKAIDDLRAQGTLYGLVLDMRENSGGFLSQAVKVSGLFISSGVVVISKYSDGTVKYYRAVDGNRYYDGPLAILISKGSASATEIVAQTLQDYGVAVVVGDECTYGKGTIQHQTVTSDASNSYFKVTIGRYYTASGKSTQITGVKSDIVIPTAYNFEDLGEMHLDYPLAADQVPPAFDDELTDIDPIARKWFLKYYSPTVQKPQQKWKQCLAALRENSAKRVSQNKNYQLFLQEIKKEIKAIGEVQFGSNDLQMDEAVNVVKDMIFFDSVIAN